MRPLRTVTAFLLCLAVVSCGAGMAVGAAPKDAALTWALASTQPAGITVANVKVYRSQVGCQKAADKTWTLSASTTTLTDTTVLKNRMYTYWVTVLTTDGGESDPSPCASATF